MKKFFPALALACAPTFADAALLQYETTVGLYDPVTYQSEAVYGAVTFEIDEGTVPTPIYEPFFNNYRWDFGVTDIHINSSLGNLALTGFEVVVDPLFDTLRIEGQFQGQAITWSVFDEDLFSLVDYEPPRDSPTAGELINALVTSPPLDPSEEEWYQGPYGDYQPYGMTFAQGVTIFNFVDGKSLFTGHYIGDLRLVDALPTFDLNDTPQVPLPATAFLLLGSVGALGAVRSRSRRG